MPTARSIHARSSHARSSHGLRHLTTLCGLAAIALATPVHADIVWSSGPGHNGHSYRLVAEASGITWDAAELAAVALGGTLATTTSANENDFVFALAASDPSAWFTDGSGHARGPWLGGFQPPGSAEPAGGWTWVNGDGPFAFTAWDPGQPNNSGGVESRLQYFGTTAAFSKKWNDASASVKMLGYVVEFAPAAGAVPEPATWAGLGLGLALLAWGRRGRSRTANG